MLLSEWFRALVGPSTFRVEQRGGWWWSAVGHLFPGQSWITENKQGKRICPWLGRFKPTLFEAGVLCCPCFLNGNLHQDVKICGTHRFWITHSLMLGGTSWKSQSLFLIWKKSERQRTWQFAPFLHHLPVLPKVFNPWTTFLPTQESFYNNWKWDPDLLDSGPVQQFPGKGKCLAGRIFT